MLLVSLLSLLSVLAVNVSVMSHLCVSQMLWICQIKVGHSLVDKWGQSSPGMVQ